MRCRRCFRSAWLSWSIGLVASATLSVAPAVVARERFEVPQGCGNEANFERELERLTGEPAPPEVPTSLVIEAIDGAGYELRLLVGNELRVLRDPDCLTLWRSAIVISAATLGVAPPATELAPDASAPSALPPEAPVVPAAPSSAPARLPAPPNGSAPAEQNAPRAAPRAVSSPRVKRTRRPSLARARAARRSRPVLSASSEFSSVSPARPPLDDPRGVRYGVDLSAGVSGGVLPGLGAVLGLGARVEAWPAAALLALSYWPERSASRDGRGVDVSAVGVRAAGAFWVARNLQVLGGVELNRLAGVGLEGVSGRSSDNAWQLAPTLGLSVIAWDNRYLRIELGAIGRAALIRPVFVVTGYGEVYQVPVFGADAIIRGAWLFP